MNLEYVKQVGIGAAFKSGKVLTSYLGNLPSIEKKGTIDLVTKADLESEKAIIDIINYRFPDHSILAEESGISGGNPNLKWIIDPLDGTTNFAYSLGIFAVSIAFELNGEVVVGVVLNPCTGELFTAIKGHGAHLNDHPISISKHKTVADSLLVTGFPYNFTNIFPDIMTRFGNCLKASMGVRRLGSAALDLCFVACGRFTGFWEQNLNPWDTAAGVLIAHEAGAHITDFSNNPFNINKKEIIATNNKIHKEMINLLKIG